MGEFSQNLLKLTEFPFSYSLIGLLALISGQGINPEQLSFAQVGPLLILMGFVATTLSIVDPVGVFQRKIIEGRYLLDRVINNLDDLRRLQIFGQTLQTHFRSIWSATPYEKQYYNAILYTPERLKELYKVKEIPDSGVEIEGETLHDIVTIMHGLKRSTLRTKWITAEVDRITALIYFMIVISVFIVAALILPDFLLKFAQFTKDIEGTKTLILSLSTTALVLVAWVSYLRMRRLRAKAAAVFRYLIALEAIKTGKENFKSTLQEIERYLDDSDWVMAEYWIGRIQKEYSEFISKEFEK
jgi:hypothetical protein